MSRDSLVMAWGRWDAQPGSDDRAAVRVAEVERFAESIGVKPVRLQAEIQVQRQADPGGDVGAAIDRAIEKVRGKR